MSNRSWSYFALTMSILTFVFVVLLAYVTSDIANIFFTLLGIPMTVIISFIALFRNKKNQWTTSIALYLAGLMVIAQLGRIPFVWFALLFSVLWGIYRVKRWRIKVTNNAIRELVLTLFFLYLLAVFYVTFHPFYFSIPNPKQLQFYDVPFHELSEQFQRGTRLALYYGFGNIALLLPFGFMVPWLKSSCRRWWRVVLAGFIVSLTIESHQLLFTNRSAEIDDLILNTLGTWLGYGLYSLSMKFIKH